MKIIDRIKYDGKPNGLKWLIYKCPSEQFVLGTQLIVSQGQEALFIKGGKATDLFGPGTYTLTTGNLPIFNKIANLPFDGKTPFTAEVYFINKTVNLDMKWGTSTPIPIEDPKYRLILSVGAHGQYGINIVDSRLFVSRIIGAIPNGMTIDYLIILKYFNGLINTKIKSVTAEYLIRKQISFTEISQYLSELSDAFKKVLDDEFERFGIEIVNFYCEAITPKQKENENLQRLKKDIFSENTLKKEVSEIDVSKYTTKFYSGEKENVVPSGQWIICSKCGSQNSSAIKFCGNCGNELITTIRCPFCNADMPIGMNFCGQCGKSLVSLKCISCGFINRGGIRFCGNCGQKI